LIRIAIRIFINNTLIWILINNSDPKYLFYPLFRIENLQSAPSLPLLIASYADGLRLHRRQPSCLPFWPAALRFLCRCLSRRSDASTLLSSVIASSWIRLNSALKLAPLINGQQVAERAARECASGCLRLAPAGVAMRWRSITRSSPSITGSTHPPDQRLQSPPGCLAGVRRSQPSEPSEGQGGAAGACFPRVTASDGAESGGPSPSITGMQVLQFCCCCHAQLPIDHGAVSPFGYTGALGFIVVLVLFGNLISFHVCFCTK
jgi:hypothetical protein